MAGPRSQTELARLIAEAYRYEKFDQAVKLEKELAELQSQPL